MKLVAGVWLPDHELHMVELFESDLKRMDGRAMYQQSKIETALKHCRGFRFAIDVGAHVGMWTLQLAKRFDVVLAIEPNAENFECLERNLAGHENARLRQCALGDSSLTVSMETKRGSSGDSFIAEGDDVKVWRLDDLGDIGRPDFVKVDCVGYELPALRGMESLLMQCKPCICVEQKPGRAERYGFPRTGAVEYLKSLGAVERENMNGVYVLSWEDR